MRREVLWFAQESRERDCVRYQSIYIMQLDKKIACEIASGWVLVVSVLMVLLRRRGKKRDREDNADTILRALLESSTDGDVMPVES